MKGAPKTKTVLSQKSIPVQLLNIPVNLVKSTISWIKSGDLPPETHKTSMRIMTALLLFGFTFLTIAILCATGQAFDTYNISYPSYAFMIFITLCPGLYSLWITICCWRRVDGYSWGMIPFFD